MGGRKFLLRKVIMENETAPQAVTERENELAIRLGELEAEVKYQQSQATYWRSQYQDMVKDISANLTEDGWFDGDIDKEDILKYLCEAFDVEATKTVSFSATVLVQGTIEVNLFETDNTDLDYEVSNAFDMWSSGTVSIDNWEIQEVNEE
jgi:hypothetical protein